MRIYSHNVNSRNKHLDRVKAEIRKGDYDVVCLQEFPADKAEDLGRELGFEHTFLARHDIFFREGFHIGGLRHEQRNVTLVRGEHQVHGYCNTRHSPHSSIFPRKLDKIAKHNIETGVLDLNCEDTNYRIFNTHMEHHISPDARVSQFWWLMNAKLAWKKNVVCGDLNSFGHWAVNWATWPFHGNVPGRLFTNEREELKVRLDLLRMINPFEGQRTHALYPGQIDYILLEGFQPHEVEAAKAKVLPRNGSDHHALFLEL